MNKMILTAGPSITKKEINYVNDAIKNGWNNNWNFYINKFEDLIKNYLGVKYALSTSSATGALHLSLLASGIKKNSEIILPEISWIASASAIKYIGAKPVFCDVDKDSWTIDTNKIEKLITKKTKAIMPVHLYGTPSNTVKIKKLANKYRLKIIEDAAPALGAIVGKQKIGSNCDFSCFSFQGAKMITTGEGGMLVTNNKKLFEKAKYYSEHCRDPKSPLDAMGIGYKYKMSNLQAALGCAQLERIDTLINKKRLINKWYNDNLENFTKVKVTKDPIYGKSIHWMTSIEMANFNKNKRSRFIKELRDKKIDTRPVFSPMSSFPMFKKINENNNAYRIGYSSINLPSGHNLTHNQIKYVSKIIKELL